MSCAARPRCLELLRLQLGGAIARSDSPISAANLRGANPGNWHPIEWDELLDGRLGPWAIAMLTAVVRSLAPQMAKAGIATPEQLGLDTLMDRISIAVRDAGSTFLPPILVGAWGRLPDPESGYG